MKKKQRILILSIFTVVILIGLVVALYLLRAPQTTVNRATTEPMCPANGASCSWDSDGSATSFKVEVVDENTGNTILTTTTSNKAVQFTPIPNHKYTCNVTPINSCGEGPAATASNICIPEATPTNTPSPSPTLTPTPTVIACQQPSTCMTEEACTSSGGKTNGERCETEGTICCVPAESTPTPTPTETPVPTATYTPTPTATPTPIPTYTPVPTYTPIPTYTPYPTYTPFPSATPTVLPTATPYPTYTPQPTFTSAPTPTPTEIVIAVNNTNTPTPTREGTAVPTIPSAGIPVAWYVIFIPLALLALGMVF